MILALWSSVEDAKFNFVKEVLQENMFLSFSSCAEITSCRHLLIQERARSPCHLANHADNHVLLSGTIDEVIVNFSISSKKRQVRLASTIMPVNYNQWEIELKNVSNVKFRIFYISAATYNLLFLDNVLESFFKRPKICHSVSPWLFIWNNLCCAVEIK